MKALSRRAATKCLTGFAAIFLALGLSATVVDASGSGKPRRVRVPRSYKVEEAGDVTYVKLTTMTLSIFKDFKNTGRIALGLDIETKSGEEKKVLEVLPRLQAKYTQFISQSGAPIIRRGKLRVRFLCTNLQRIADRILGDDVATVLIRQAIKM